MCAVGGGSLGFERSIGALDAAEAPGWAHTVISAVRFSRALVASAIVMGDYRALFALHDDYTTGEYQSARARVHTRSAERLLRLCRAQGGCYVKIGQHIASMTHGIPAEYSSGMRSLEDAAAHRPFPQIRRLLAKELREAGGLAAFSELEKRPVAAASLAQVHRARLADDGREVAVKIQYPGLEVLCQTDLTSIQTLSWLLSRVFPTFSLDWIVQQFRRNLAKELDFTLEAESSMRTKRNFEDDRRIAVPGVVGELTTKRVLTMDYIDGIRVNDVAALRKAGIDPGAVAQAVVDSFAAMVFVYGYCHCDNHFGNLLVRPAGGGKFELFILDHGLYRELDDDFRKKYCRLWRGLVLRNTQEVEEACAALGAPGLANIFSIFLLNRSWTSARRIGTDIRNKMSPAEVDELKQGLRQFGMSSETDFVSFMENVPEDLLLVFKMNSLVRNVNRALGASINRFKVNARYAIRGLAHENETTAGHSVESKGISNSVALVFREISKRFYLLVDQLTVEVQLLLIDTVVAILSWWRGSSSEETSRIG